MWNAAIRLYARRARGLVSRLFGARGPAITSASVIQRESVESLVSGADDYFRRAIADGATTFLKRKPFHDLHETPRTLYALGQMLDGARLAPGLHVLEYGAGTGWLSGALWQMGCRVTCVDASDAALGIARESFEQRHALAAHPELPVEIARTDGHTLPVASASVDRVICFDAFHHIPNQLEMLREFGRVLRQGGVACFAEPGRRHSASSQSQHEMRNFRVLENDIVLEDIWELARAAGFTDVTVRPVLDLPYTVNLKDYLALVNTGRVGYGGRDALMHGTLSNSIFFLQKGSFVVDSRFARALAARIAVTPKQVRTRPGHDVTMRVRCSNSGTATWLSASDSALGRVNVAIQLCDAEGRVVSRDWRRVPLPRDVGPGEAVEVECRLNWPGESAFSLRFDLVSEGIVWFGASTEPGVIPVVVTAARTQDQ